MLKLLEDIGMGLMGKKGTIKYAFGKLGAGKMLDLKLDGEKGMISFKVELSGEVSPICLKATYNVAKREGHSFIDVSNLSIDREWMNVLAHLYLEKQGGTIPIPDASANYLKLLK